MRNNFNIYPEGLELIRKSGIEDRVKKLKASRDGLPYIGGAVTQMDIIDSANYVKKRGYYKNIPDSISEQYKESMNKMLNAPETFFWTVEKNGKTITEKFSLEDMLLFTGEMAALILSPEELWDNNKFGFDTPLEFISTVSAYVIEQSHNSSGHSLREGYTWTRARDDGSKILTEIGGDHNADFRIYQTDIAAYHALDPFGSKILFRPEISDDRKVVAAYHSNESLMLAATLHYIEQLGLDVKILSNNMQGLKEYANSLEIGQRIDAGGYSSNAKMAFLSWIFPIPKLDENNNTEKHPSYHLSIYGEGWYDIYLASNNDMIISYNDKDIQKNPKRINARFTPDDAEHLIKGLIYQSIKGLGRTSPKELFDVLDYRFSEKFEEDMDRYRKM